MSPALGSSAVMSSSVVSLRSAVPLRTKAAPSTDSTPEAAAEGGDDPVASAGAEEPSWPTIVASGRRGARPHDVPGPDPIPADTLVVIDMGAVVDGYCSDMTRTFGTGTPPPRLAEIYGVCLDAQEAAMAAAAPGMTGAELDAVARARIVAGGYGDAFGHGLGHGVGLVIHESPGVRPESGDALLAGMAITIEPGIYLEGEGGVRIEDLIVLWEDGSEVLSHSPKDLRIVA